ncbi:Eef2k, partial [Symbiodinium sp. CCMP2456]
ELAGVSAELEESSCEASIGARAGLARRRSGDPARVRELALVPRTAWDEMVPGHAWRLKLSSVLDPTLDADVTPLGTAALQKLYADYRAKYGDFLSPDADPSSDQLASLKKQTFTSYTLNVATGEWSKKEQLESPVLAAKAVLGPVDEPPTVVRELCDKGAHVLRSLSASATSSNNKAVLKTFHAWVEARIPPRSALRPDPGPSQLMLPGGGSAEAGPPGTSHSGHYAEPKPKIKAALVDSTAQSKASGAPPGQKRPGDLASWLVHYGFYVCCVDTIADTPCDVLDEAQWSAPSTYFRRPGTAALSGPSRTETAGSHRHGPVRLVPLGARDGEANEGYAQRPREYTPHFSQFIARSLFQGYRQRTLEAETTKIGRAISMEKWPTLREPATALLKGNEPRKFDSKVIESIRAAASPHMGANKARPQTTQIRHGAPLGIAESIPCNGVFPRVDPVGVAQPEELDRQALQGWTNYKSAEEEAGVLDELIRDYEARAFCQVVQATRILGGPPVLNKLGVLVKEKTDARGRKVKKARGQGDLGPLPVFGQPGLPPTPEAPGRCGLPPCGLPQGTRRVDGVHRYSRRLHEYPCWPGPTVSRGHPEETEQGEAATACPLQRPGLWVTVWGRAAAWLGRTAMATSASDVQIYVDDPMYVLDGPELETAASDLTVVLLWTAVDWIPGQWGAKTSNGLALLRDTNKFLAKPAVGCRELRSYTGSLSFVAGLVPHLRPFLASFWAVLTRHGLTNEGRPLKVARKWIHVRRISPALGWVRALLGGGNTIGSSTRASTLEIVTDASPRGLGAAERGLPKYNTLWEGLALLAAFRLWLPSLAHGATFRAKSDNLGVLFALSKGRAKSPELNVLAREIAYDKATRPYQVKGLVRLPGITNVQADALWRQFAPEAKDFPKELLGDLLSSVPSRVRPPKEYRRGWARGIGPAKQAAAALFLGKLVGVDQASCEAPGGPARPVTSTVVASWWILREIDASRARVKHITVDWGTKTISWLLPSSKTDVAALGATRKHSCSCAVLHPELCPFHCMVLLLQGKRPQDPVFVDKEGGPTSKSGWANAFQNIAAQLGLPLRHHNEARAFTGHTARATGAQFVAERLEDSWEVDFKAGRLIRHHRIYRKDWYVPDNSCPVNFKKLKGEVKVERVLPIQPYVAKQQYDWRKALPGKPDDLWVGKTIFYLRPMPRVSINEEPIMISIEPEGKRKKHSYLPRADSESYLTARDCPRPDSQDTKRAILWAKQFERVIQCMCTNVKTSCDYECEEEGFVCEHCEKLTRPACAGLVPGFEFLADTGSEEDLISKHDHQAHFPTTPVEVSNRPASLIAANGPVQGNKSVKLEVPEL